MTKANPAVIGGFVIGAIALAVIGILVLGGTAWFKTQNRYVAYFPGSIQGLRVGADVDFRGVTIGQVVEILVAYDQSNLEFRLPVVIEIDPTRVELIGEEVVVSDEEDMERLINAGLRAQLQSQSLLTGLLLVDLDVKPDTEASLIGTNLPYQEIPTIPSGMEQIQQTAGDIAQQIPGLLQELNQLLTEVSAGIGESKGDVEKILSDLARFTDSLNKATPALDRLVEGSSETVLAVQRSAATVDEILKANKEGVGATVEELQAATGAVQRMADQINNLVAENRAGLRDFTETGLYEFTGLAQDAQRMVDQITRVAEELERDPARFLFGDRTQGIQTEQ